MSRDLADAANEAFLNVLRATGSEEQIARAEQDVNRTAEERVAHLRLPHVEVPQIKWWQEKLLSTLGAATPEDQLRELATAVRTKGPLLWSHTGIAMDIPDLDSALMGHPDTELVRYITQITQSVFDLDLWVEFETYFRTADGNGGLDTKRLRRVYLCYLFIAGTDAQAKLISSVLSITPDLKAMRARIIPSRAAFRQQYAEVEQFKAALAAFRQSGEKGSAPDWRDFVMPPE